MHKSILLKTDSVGTRNSMSAQITQFLLVILLVSLPIIIHAQQNDDINRFGVIEGFWFPDLTCELGVGWERIIFDWEQHQPDSPDDWYTLNVDDRWLRAADACNREVVAVLKHTPAWATDGTAGVGVPRGLTLPLDHPNNYWANFIHKTVDYYASRGVTHFIIWNEPDITSDTYGYEFEGTLEDYYQMLRVASIVARQTNPAVVIHLAGTTYWHDVNEGRRPYMTRLIERIVSDPEAPQYDYYFDVLSLHIYFKTDTVYNIVTEMRQMLDSNDLSDKAIWINETNAAPTIDLAWPVNRPVFHLDLQHQANFLIQSVTLGLAAGAERIAVYKLYDQLLPEGGESFGILSPSDASVRPAFYTWQMMTEHFDDTVSASLQQTDTLDAVQLLHANGQQTIALWARTEHSTQVSLTSTNDKAYQIDMYGNITIMRPNNDEYSLSLSSALCEEGEGCFLGGNVVLIVQPQGQTTVREMMPDNTITLEFD
jgi:hypothetical protein